MQPIRLEEKRAEYDGGFALLPTSLIHGDLSHGAVRLYASLLTYRRFDGSEPPFPSRKTLASNLGVTPRTIDALAKELEAAGHLRRERRVSERGDLTSNYWHLLTLPREVGVATPRETGFARVEKQAAHERYLPERHLKERKQSKVSGSSKKSLRRDDGLEGTGFSWDEMAAGKPPHGYDMSTTEGRRARYLGL